MSLPGVVNDSGNGRRILRDVCLALRARSGIDFGETWRIKLFLATAEELRKQVDSAYCRNPIGSATWEGRRRGGVWYKDSYHITIRRGLSHLDFAACCAHELGHIYQYRHNFPDLPDVINEGLCELLKLTWYTTQGRDVGRRALIRMWNNSDPVYGEGFRLAFEAHLGRNLLDVMDYVRRFGNLPPVLAAPGSPRPTSALTPITPWHGDLRQEDLLAPSSPGGARPALCP